MRMKTGRLESWSDRMFRKRRRRPPVLAKLTRHHVKKGRIPGWTRMASRGFGKIAA